MIYTLGFLKCVVTLTIQFFCTTFDTIPSEDCVMEGLSQLWKPTAVNVATVVLVTLPTHLPNVGVAL